MKPSGIIAAIVCGTSILCGPVAAWAQDLGVKAPVQKQAIVITNAIVHTVSGKTISPGWVSFEGGRITGVGEGASPAAPAGGARVEDAAGKHVYPGLIASYSHLGLTEVGAVRATNDISEVGVGTPELRANVSVNPDSTLIPVARSNGVLVAAVFPQSSFQLQSASHAGPVGLFPGRASVMRLDGWTWEDMTVLGDAGLAVNWPYPRPVEAWWQPKSREDQQKDIDAATRAIEGMFIAAHAYIDAKHADPSLPTDVRFEAMRSVFKQAAPTSGDQHRQSPVFVEVNDYDAIQQAVTVLSRQGLNIVIVGGNDAAQCADLLKRHNVAVIVGGTYHFPKRDDSAYNEGYTLPARLEAAGVSWCLASGEETAHERNLPYVAGLSVAHGLDRDAAVRGMTLSAARILGVDDTLGSIDKGKAATLLVADGDILEVTTHVVHAYIDGREVDLSNKQKALDAKYRERYKQVDEMRAH